jgi:transposase-like protein
MRKYDKEFKQQAVKKYSDGQSVASISREIEVNEGLIISGRTTFCKKMVNLIKRNYQCRN